MTSIKQLFLVLTPGIQTAIHDRYKHYMCRWKHPRSWGQKVPAENGSHLRPCPLLSLWHSWSGLECHCWACQFFLSSSDSSPPLPVSAVSSERPLHHGGTGASFRTPPSRPELFVLTDSDNEVVSFHVRGLI